MNNLDDLICAINDKVKKAAEETLCSQYENRKRLENILVSNPPESSKLAENTRQFFYLCPKYTTLNQEFHKNNEESNVSVEINDPKQRVIQNGNHITLLNLDNEDKWKFIDNTENVNIVTPDYDNNPYILSSEIKEMLLDVEKKIFQKNLQNEEVQSSKKLGSESDTRSSNHRYTNNYECY
ncbi:unnamed protein product [Xylocopa violacea]|uniref:Uncharacterized protein n=1 Tax=Xylocopa violacea TaxID=135666 RepID=A0ABP1PEQ2_XYLVO